LALVLELRWLSKHTDIYPKVGAEYEF